MVNKVLRFILLSFLFLFQLAAQEVKVSANMSEYSLVEGEPLQGTVSITHDSSQKVDAESFTLKGKPMKVEFVREVRISPNAPLVITIYYFQLPSEKRGLHLLDSIGVKVGDKVYQSPITSYQVTAGDSPVKQAPPATKPMPAQPETPAVASDSRLRIEASVKGPTTLFPGQRTTFIYRFVYSGYIELLKETLPMLEATGLKKIGSTQHRDYLEGVYSVSEFSQEVEADQPGIFTFGPSIVEGKAYTVDSAGNKIYAKNVLHSEAAPITITVSAFPEKDKPASFNGAIGHYIFNASLNSEPKATVGEQIVLALEMIGDPANFSTVSAPDLCCQPGFPGMFQQSDLPPTSSVQENIKRFLVTLRPLSATIKAIPPIEFSSWDPSKDRYVVQLSKSIPLTVSGASGKKEAATTLGRVPPSEAPPLNTHPQPIEIHRSEPLEPSDLHNKWTGSWWILLLIPVAAVLIYLQKNIQAEWVKNQQVKNGPQAEEFLQEALKASPETPQFYQGVKQALMQLLIEKGLITDAALEPEKLPQQGEAGEVRAFLSKLNEARFAKNQKPDPRLATEAQALFKKIRG